MIETKCNLFKIRPDPVRHWECPCNRCKLYWEAMDIYHNTTLSWAECLSKAKVVLENK